MEISPVRWMARVGNRVSHVLPLGAAKKAIKELFLLGTNREPRDWIPHANRVMAAEIDSIPIENVGTDPPLVIQSLNQDGTYSIDLLWGERTADYPSEIYPEDVAVQKLTEWGFRGTFAMCWPNGFVATYKRIAWPDFQIDSRPTEERPDFDPDGPTPGALQGATISSMGTRAL